MSKYSEELIRQWNDTGKIKAETKKILLSGQELAFKEIHGANYENLVRRIIK